ncbi:tRNA methyltransferase 10 homolog A-like [Littorina saxatilis]|uniref:tRNA (guanine(9)-N(1))-methyltransferase n=1 Tax=Littorina saxatilis TaxID=31220 RepID=A0AAN9GLK7_9CAEN
MSTECNAEISAVDGPDSTQNGIGAAADSSSTSSYQQPLSKNQIKKQKKREKWLQIKSQIRHAEREKKKRRFAEMKKRGEDIGPSRKSLKKNRMVDSACRLRVVIDCSFDDFMTEKDTTFLVQQIQHSYSANRRAENPLQLYVCGIVGKAKQRLDSIGDYKGWDLHKEEREYMEVFPKEDIVYLSSESPNVLDTLDETKVYVIGGLVDHNHHKGLCHNLAEEKGLAHAQLPLGQFLQLKSRKVLTINHVFEILLRFTETKDWQTSFLSVLPQRKGACAKDNKEKDASCDNTQDVKATDCGNSSETCDKDVKGEDCVDSSGTCDKTKTDSETCGADVKATDQENTSEISDKS